MKFTDKEQSKVHKIAQEKSVCFILTQAAKQVLISVFGCVLLETCIHVR